MAFLILLVAVVWVASTAIALYLATFDINGEPLPLRKLIRAYGRTLIWFL
jgi:hypothetical protein